PAIAAAARSVKFPAYACRSPKPFVDTRQPFSSVPTVATVCVIFWNPLFMPVSSAAFCSGMSLSTGNGLPASTPIFAKRARIGASTAAGARRRAERQHEVQVREWIGIGRLLADLRPCDRGCRGRRWLVLELRERQRPVSGLNLLHVVEVSR